MLAFHQNFRIDYIELAIINTDNTELTEKISPRDRIEGSPKILCYNRHHEAIKKHFEFIFAFQGFKILFKNGKNQLFKTFFKVIQ